MKVCNKCKEEKHISEFYKHSSTKDGYNTICKACMKTYKRKGYRQYSIKEGKKKCKKCGEWLNLEYFYKDKNKGYYSSYCKECIKKRANNNYNRATEISVKEEYRKCSICKKWLDINHFYLLNKNNISLKHSKSTCKECTKTYKYLDKYGLTNEEYKKMYNDQKGVCKICGKNNNTKEGKAKRLCVDHCHKTNTIRGLLCDNCNIGLGNFKDDVELLEKAINYLKI